MDFLTFTPHGLLIGYEVLYNDSYTKFSMVFKACLNTPVYNFFKAGVIVSAFPNL